MTTKNYKGYALTDDGIKHFLRDHRHKKFEHIAPTIKREATKLQKAMAQIVKAVDATVSAAEQARLRKPLTGMERLRKWLHKLHSELKSQAVAQKEYRRIDGQRRRNGITTTASLVVTSLACLVWNCHAPSSSSCETWAIQLPPATILLFAMTATF